MKRETALMLFVPLVLACSQSAMMPARSSTDAVAQVRQAEIEFAKAFNDGDADRFTSMMDPDAYFLGPRRILHGKAEIMSVWSDLMRENQFTWEPERVVVTGDRTLGLSTGPVRDKTGKVIGQYSSIWRYQADGSWKLVFDGPGSSCPPLASN